MGTLLFPAVVVFLVQKDQLILSLCVLSGRSPRAQTLEFLEGRGYSAEAPPSPFHALNVTVPGAPACWWDTVQLFGSRKVRLCVFIYLNRVELGPVSESRFS